METKFSSKISLFDVSSSSIYTNILIITILFKFVCNKCQEGTNVNWHQLRNWQSTQVSSCSRPTGRLSKECYKKLVVHAISRHGTKYRGKVGGEKHRRGRGSKMKGLKHEITGFRTTTSNSHLGFKRLSLSVPVRAVDRGWGWYADQTRTDPRLLGRLNWKYWGRTCL